jgi:toxoflavin synthase
MPDPAQYDPIAASYSASKQGLRAQVLEHHVLGALGDVTGMDILDVGCGDGVFARFVKRAGARRVIGVDISGGLIRIAREAEACEPIGVEYRIHSALELPALGPFDAALAIFLLNYAETRDDLRRMCQRLRASLAPGALLVGATNLFEAPDFFVNGSNLTKYGITFRVPERLREGDRVTMELHLETAISAQFTHWSRATYEHALREAGFRDLTIAPLTPSADAIDELGQAYWQDFTDHPAQYILRAVRE